MARLVGAVAIVAATLTSTALSGCAATPKPPRPIIPTMNGNTPETETMLAAAPAPRPAEV